jgi:hypothetical protein
VIAFVAGEISTTDPLSSLAHTPCSSTANQSGPPSTSIAAFRPSVGSAWVVPANAPDVAGASVDTIVDTGGGLVTAAAETGAAETGAVEVVLVSSSPPLQPATSMPAHANKLSDRPLTRRTLTA